MDDISSKSCLGPLGRMGIDHSMGLSIDYPSMDDNYIMKLGCTQYSHDLGHLQIASGKPAVCFGKSPFLISYR